MSEQSVVSVRASVMLYDELNKKWVTSGSSPGVSKVDIYSHSMHLSFRVVGRRLSDQEVVINCGLSRGMKYNQATPTFHQWRDSRQVYGLNFSSKDEADAFALAMTHAIDALSGGGNSQPQPSQQPQTMAPPHRMNSAPKQPPPAPPATSPTGRPPIPVQIKPVQTGGGPPPPPPPPMPMNVPVNSITVSSDNSLASALANAVVRKANAQPDGSGPCGTVPEVGGAKSSGGGGGGGGGGGSLMDEMAKAFARRKAGGQKDGSVQAKSEGRPNLNPKPLQPPTKLQLHSKTPEGGPRPKTPEGVEQIMVNGLNNNHETGLEALKVEILREVRLELNQMKLEIIEVIKSEMSKNRINL